MGDHGSDYVNRWKIPMFRSLLWIAYSALCTTGVVTGSHAEGDTAVAYVLQIRQPQEGGDRHFVMRCTEYQRRPCKQRITIWADGHLQDIDVIALFEPRNVFLKFHTAEGYLRVGSQPFAHLATGSLSAAQQDIVLSEPLSDDGEALKTVPVLRYTKAVATLHIDIRPVH
jgi:hypothetical protein